MAGSIINIPYYGGAKGQVLQLIHNPDGSVTTTIIKTGNPMAMPQKSPLNRLQEAAARLVTIQESTKTRGQFSNDDSKIYADNLYQLGVAAQELATSQQNPDELKKLFQLMPSINRHSATLEFGAANSNFPMDSVNQEPDTVVQSDDSVQLTAPNNDASVAEAKPIGLSIAGIGGVASSKPVGTAIAGPSSLAVSRPVATAIAGISEEEAAALGVQQYPIKKKSTPQRKDEELPLPLESFSYKLNKNGVLIGPQSTNDKSGKDEKLKPTKNEDDSVTITSANKTEENEIASIKNEQKNENLGLANDKVVEEKKESIIKENVVSGYYPGSRIPIEYYNFGLLHPSSSAANLQQVAFMPQAKQAQYSGVIFV